MIKATLFLISATLAITVLAAGLVLPAEPPKSVPQVKPGSFQSTGSMTTARLNHAAVLLGDGTVLIAGGQSTSAAFAPNLSSAEVYTPGTGTFHAVGNLSIPRSRFTATLLSNGTVLIAGGLNCTNAGCVAADTAEIYNPASQTFTPTGSMTIGRYAHTATLLKDGRVLITGGVCLGSPDCPNDGLNQTAEVYDSNSATFLPVASMETERCSHSATLLNNGKVLIAGGFQGSQGIFGCTSGTYLASAELFNPANNSFVSVGDLPAPRALQSAVLLPKGPVVLIGRAQDCNSAGCVVTAETDLYQPSKRTFRVTGDTIFNRSQQAAANICRNQVLVTGGINCNQGNCQAIVTSEIYSGTKFTQAANMDTARFAFTATRLLDGSVLVAGGGAVFNPVLFSPAIPYAQRFFPGCKL